jgi:hypothetical protein
MDLVPPLEHPQQQFRLEFVLEGQLPEHLRRCKYKLSCAVANPTKVGFDKCAVITILQTVSTGSSGESKQALQGRRSEGGESIIPHLAALGAPGTALHRRDWIA